MSEESYRPFHAGSPAFRLGWTARRNFVPPAEYQENPYGHFMASQRHPIFTFLERFVPALKRRRVYMADEWSRGWIAANRLWEREVLERVARRWSQR